MRSVPDLKIVRGQSASDIANGCRHVRVGHVTTLRSVRRQLSERLDAQSTTAVMFQQGAITLRELQAIQVQSLISSVAFHWHITYDTIR